MLFRRKTLDWGVAHHMVIEDDGDRDLARLRDFPATGLERSEPMVMVGRGLDHFPIQFDSEETHDLLREGYFGDREWWFRELWPVDCPLWDEDRCPKGWELRFLSYREVHQAAYDSPVERLKFVASVNEKMKIVQEQACAVIRLNGQVYLEHTAALVITRFVNIVNPSCHPELSVRDYIHNMTFSKRLNRWVEVRFKLQSDHVEDLHPDDLREGPYVL